MKRNKKSTGDDTKLIQLYDPDFVNRLRSAGATKLYHNEAILRKNQANKNSRFTQMIKGLTSKHLNRKAMFSQIQ